jgi:TolB-like protein/Tfp pilus assembly protein PilF
MGSARPGNVVRFGSFHLDLQAGELRRNGMRVRVPDQSIQVLAILLEQSGEVVTRAELQQRLWPNGTIVEFEHGINSVINRLRQALEDSPDEPRFIETLPRRGYRFLVPVEESVSEIQDTSIAVLPFTNLSAEKENDYFSDGLAEEILNALSQVEDLRVAARTSSFSFKGKAVEISEIGAGLRVSNVLEGGVRRAGDRLRVTVRLIKVSNGFHLWSERYDRRMDDLFDVQDEIARAITERLKVSLIKGVKRSTENPEAYELYLKGRHYWHQRFPATVRLAIQCFEDAIKLDPRCALAYAGLADCYGILAAYTWVSPKDARAPAQAAVTQAVTLAPSLWEVNVSRGFYALHFESWRDAGSHFQRATLINPRSSLAGVLYGLFLALDGRAEEAVAQTTQACQADPLSPFIHSVASMTLYILKRFDEAEHMAHHALELQPGYLQGLWTHGMALCGLGRNKEAIDALERAVTASRAPLFVGLLGLAYARAGRLDDTARLLHELENRSSRGEYVPARALLHIYVGQGDLPAIQRALSNALAETTPALALRTTSSPFLEAYGDPEVHRLLMKLYGGRDSSTANPN